MSPSLLAREVVEGLRSFVVTCCSTTCFVCTRPSHAHKTPKRS